MISQACGIVSHLRIIAARLLPKEHQQFGTVASVEAELGALAERQQSARQRRIALDPDQRFGADEVARRPEQRMSALDRPHLDAVDPLDRAAEQCRVDVLDAAAVGAEALVRRRSATKQRRRCRRISGHSCVTTWSKASMLSASIAASTASWIEETAPEWPRAKAMRSWLASSTAPSRSRSRATARSSKGITVAIASEDTPDGG